MNKKLIIFLLINLVIAVVLCANLFFKAKEKTPVVTNNIPQNTVNQSTVVPKVIDNNVNTLPVLQPQTTPKVNTPAAPIPNTTYNTTNSLASCVIYGPVTRDNRSILETLLQKANFLQNATIIAKPIYEIFWNLGSNKANALALFEKQKNGPLQNDKFKIKQDENNDWIVPIAEITADENNAAIITKELADKANQINAGGKWQYRASENVYFYQFKDSNSIPKDIKEVMTKTLALPSARCS